MGRIRVTCRERDSKMGRLWTVIGTLIVIGAIGGSAYWAYSTFIKTAETKTNYVRYGDTVLVNYIGQFEDKKVFDTSLFEVASNNVSYPKAISFTLRSKTAYTPFNFTIGQGKVIQGWETGLIGMKVGDTKHLTVPKEQGYHDSDPSLIKVMALEETLPMTQYFNKTNFKSKYLVDAALGLQVKDPQWGWYGRVVGMVSDIVTVQSQPYMGEIVHPYKAWSSKVTSIDSTADGGKGIIKIKHSISSELVNNVKDTDAAGTEFRLTGYNPEAGTFTIDYNREVVGKTLYFTVTLVKLYRA